MHKQTNKQKPKRRGLCFVKLGSSVFFQSKNRCDLIQDVTDFWEAIADVRVKTFLRRSKCFNSRIMTFDTTGEGQIFHVEMVPFSLTRGRSFCLHPSLATGTHSRKRANNPPCHSLFQGRPTWPGCQKSWRNFASIKPCPVRGYGDLQRKQLSTRH